MLGIRCSTGELQKMKFGLRSARVVQSQPGKVGLYSVKTLPLIANGEGNTTQ